MVELKKELPEIFEEFAEQRKNSFLAIKEVKEKETEKVLTDRQTDLNEFGRMLDHTWKLKRQTGNAVDPNRRASRSSPNRSPI